MLLYFLIFYFCCLVLYEKFFGFDNLAFIFSAITALAIAYTLKKRLGTIDEKIDSKNFLANIIVIFSPELWIVLVALILVYVLG